MTIQIVIWLDRPCLTNKPQKSKPRVWRVRGLGRSGWVGGWEVVVVVRTYAAFLGRNFNRLAGLTSKPLNRQQLGKAGSCQISQPPTRSSSKSSKVGFRPPPEDPHGQSLFHRFGFCYFKVGARTFLLTARVLQVSLNQILAEPSS